MLSMALCVAAGATFITVQAALQEEHQVSAEVVLPVSDSGTPRIVESVADPDDTPILTLTSLVQSVDLPITSAKAKDTHPERNFNR